ncbi:acyl carrier protein [Candidatus Kaiserbacteria bacterium]|nr:MAG: acyl carrier protein [Candidatus Kaiserbacteria bacterium]
MKPYSDIILEVKFLISETLECHVDTIDETHLIAELSEDSIQLFELLLAFERKYAVQTSYEDVLTLNTVGDIAQYVGRAKYAL